MKDVEYKYMRERFLPICRQDMKDRGWDRVDFVYITGDAYVDHPSFGPAVITRLLESRGYRIGIISQPDWKDKDSVTIYGEPRLAFLVSAGNMDSMVNHYSVSKKRRKSDAYTPGRRDGQTSGLCNRGLWKPDPSDLQTDAGYSRRN